MGKLSRLYHSQAVNLGKRLRLVLPEYDGSVAHKLEILTNKLLEVPKEHHQKIGRIRDYNRPKFKLGVLKRSHLTKAKRLLKKLKSHYLNVPTIKEYWLE